jgi:hypothetical protein
MSNPTSTASASTRLNLQVHVEELRAELASVLSSRERRQIARELQAAQAKLETYRKAA